VYQQVIQVLSEDWRDIPFALLKGMYLVRDVYPDMGVRRFSDIDILVRAEHMQEVIRRLADLQYHAATAIRADRFEHSAFVNSIMFYAEDGQGPPLHVHWHLFNTTTPKYTGVPLDIEALWQRARLCAGKPAALSAEDTLLHLCEHALRHSFNRLILLRDIYEMITVGHATGIGAVGQAVSRLPATAFPHRTQDAAGPVTGQGRMCRPVFALDGEAFVRVAQDAGLARAACCALEMVEWYAGPVVDPAIMAALRPGRRGIGERVFMRWTRKGRRHPELCNLAWWSARETLRGKWRFLWQLAFPPRGVLVAAYGKPEKEIGMREYLSRILRGARQLLAALCHVRH
jgi:hypothetical protein